MQHATTANAIRRTRDITTTMITFERRILASLLPTATEPQDASPVFRSANLGRTESDVSTCLIQTGGWRPAAQDGNASTNSTVRTVTGSAERPAT